MQPLLSRAVCTCFRAAKRPRLGTATLRAAEVPAAAASRWVATARAEELEVTPNGRVQKQGLQSTTKERTPPLRNPRQLLAQERQRVYEQAQKAAADAMKHLQTGPVELKSKPSQRRFNDLVDFLVEARAWDEAAELVELLCKLASDQGSRFVLRSMVTRVTLLRALGDNARLAEASRLADVNSNHHVVYDMVKRRTGKQFKALVDQTYADFRDGHVPLDTPQRAELLQIICQSAAWATNRLTQARARLLYGMFRAKAPGGFIQLPHFAMLALVSSSVPPHGKFTHFARDVVSDFVRARSRPESPFYVPRAGKENKREFSLSEVDLNALAGAYSQLGDFDSTHDVVRRMIADRIAPMPKTVASLVKVAARDSPRIGRRVALATKQAGVPLPSTLWRELMAEAKDTYEKDATLDWEQRRRSTATEFALIVQLAGKIGDLALWEVASLRRYGEGVLRRMGLNNANEAHPGAPRPAGPRPASKAAKAALLRPGAELDAGGTNRWKVLLDALLEERQEEKATRRQARARIDQ